MEAVIGVVTGGLILGIMVLGVYISYSILDFPDLSADGSFALGGAVIAVVLKGGYSPLTGCILALMGGVTAGLITGILHVKLGISNLLSGILVMGILYSLNLRIMGRSNVPLFSFDHIFKGGIPPVILCLLIALGLKVITDRFFKTGLGYTIKAVGDNPQMVKSLGIETGGIKILGLMISNGLVALSGSIMAQYQGFVDVTMGAGTLVLGIASIIIAKSLLGRFMALKETSIIMIGTLVYQFVIFGAINAGLKATDLKLITSFVIIAFLALGRRGKYAEV